VTLICIFVLHNKRPRSLFSAFKGQFEISERSNAPWWPKYLKTLVIFAKTFMLMSKSIGGFLKAPGCLFRYCLPNNNNNNNNNSNEVMTCVAAGKFSIHLASSPFSIHLAFVDNTVY
jgi:hypothetical protein